MVNNAVCKTNVLTPSLRLASVSGQGFVGCSLCSSRACLSCMCMPNFHLCFESTCNAVCKAIHFMARCNKIFEAKGSFIYLLPSLIFYSSSFFKWCQK